MLHMVNILANIALFFFFLLDQFILAPETEEDIILPSVDGCQSHDGTYGWRWGMLADLGPGL